MSEPEERQSTAVICFGCNCGRRKANIKRAIAMLGEHSTVERISSPYESVDETGRGCNYINVVVGVRTEKDYDVMLDILKMLESEFGRNAQSKACGKMPMDADIVIWRDKIVDPVQFTKRHFSIPFAEIAAAERR